jgi:hypothetical protein
LSGGHSSVVNLTILDGNITASGWNGTGIGSVYRCSSSVERISILNGSLTLAISQPDIGGGLYSDGDVTIWNGLFDCSAINWTVCFNSSSLTFATGSIIAITNYNIVGASSTSRVVGSPELYFEYVSNSTEEGLTGLPLIHLESIPFGHRTVYTLRIDGFDSDNHDFHREVQFDGNRSRGCAFSVNSVGNYSVSFESIESWIPHFSGFLGHDGIPLFSANDLNDNFYSSVIVLPANATATSTPFPTAAISGTPTRPFTRWDVPFSRGTGQIFRSFNCFLMFFSL